MKTIRASDIARFNTKFKTISNFLCWEWLGTKGSKGYGQFKWFDPRKKKFVTIGAHRFSLFLSLGIILPKDIFTDHVCRNRICVNPNHLRAVDIATSNTENCDTVPAKNKRKTHCKHGHEFTHENTARCKTGRYCRVCKRIETLARYHRKRDLEKGPQ